MRCHGLGHPARVFELIQGLALQNFPSAVNGPGDLPAIYSVTILRRANLAQINTQGLDFDVSYRWTMGDWSLGTQVQGNYVLKYDQSAAPGSAFLSQFPFGQQRLRVRGQVNGRMGPLTAVATVNYNDDYQNQYNLPNNALSVETIGSYTTVDLHVGYELPEIGVLGGTELTVDIDNLLDEDPPFARAAFGYGVGNVLGRVVTLGVRKTF